MKKCYQYLLLFILCVQVSACAASKITIPTAEEGKARWEKFVSHRIEENPYNLQGSLRFGDNERTTRIKYLFWSNGTVPVRVDIMAGVGANIAKILETDNQLLIYFSRDNRAVRLEDVEDIPPLTSIGLSVPLSCYELSLLLRGGLNEILENLSLDTVKIVENKKIKSEHEKYQYYFSSKKFDGLLQLNEQSLPIYAEVNGQWNFTFDYNENNLPSKIVINSLTEEYRAILLIKEQNIVASYPENDLLLVLPLDTEIVTNY